MKISSVISSTALSSPEKINLRPLRSADRPALERILHDTDAFTVAEIAIALELIDEGDDGSEDSYRFVIAEIDEKVAGYVCYGHTPCTDAVYDLYWIAVDRSIQQRGIGKYLLEAVERKIIEIGGRMIVIETASKQDYEATRHFYLRNGYIIAAQIADFYSKGDDKLIYIKRFG